MVRGQSPLCGFKAKVGISPQMFITAVYTCRSPEDTCWCPAAAAGSQVGWQSIWQPSSLHKNKLCSLGLSPAKYVCLVFAMGSSAGVAKSTVLIKGPAGSWAKEAPLFVKSCTVGGSFVALHSLPWRGLHPLREEAGEEAAASPRSGNPCNPLLLGPKMALLQHVPHCWVSCSLASPAPACWCPEVRNPASPASSCPVFLCPWPCLGEAPPTEHPWQLLQVVLGQTPSDSTFGVGHHSHKRHPRNVGQG